MSAVRQGRWTDDHDGPVVVFLIGMTFNRWWRVDRWWPVFTAMPRMLAELHRDRASGLLGARTLIGARGPTVVQYWTGVEELMAYAHDDDREHRRAWRRFAAAARRSQGAVGIWHETYAVAAGAHETVYAWAPPTGLAAVVPAVPVDRTRGSAAQRLARLGGG